MLLDEIAQRLEDEGLVGGATGWTVAKGWMPPTPHRVVGIFEYPGQSPLPRIEMDRPSFQVRVRGEEHDYEIVRTKVEAIQGVLHGFSGTITGTYYVSILATGGPLSLGLDQNLRPELVQSYRTMRGR